MFIQLTIRKWGTTTSARLGDATPRHVLPTDASPGMSLGVLPTGFLHVRPTVASSGGPQDASSSSCETFR